MSKRFKNTLYTIEDIKWIDKQHCYVRNDDGTLFSSRYRTKIKPEYLPEWYFKGRYYKRWGYMSAKGITDLVYIPNRYINHFLRDDFLLISYGGKITEKSNSSLSDSFYERYEGWDHSVYGNEIITILRGARKYSGYDITPFIKKLKWKKDWLQQRYPDEYTPKDWNVDIDELFVEEKDY